MPTSMMKKLENTPSNFTLEIPEFDTIKTTFIRNDILYGRMATGEKYAIIILDIGTYIYTESNRNWSPLYGRNVE